MRNYVLPAIQVISRSINKAVFTAGLTLCLAHTVLAQVTTTQLTVSSPTVAVGVPALLTATVTDAASHSVHQGTVTFYAGSRSLGSAQIVSGSSGAFPQGTANLKTASFAPGSNSITAVFSGTRSDLKSTSAAKTLTVTGKSETTLALSGYVTGTDFWLPATVRAAGVNPPGGSVDYTHIFDGAVIGTKSLSGAKWKPDFVVKSEPVLGSNPHSSATSGDFNGDGFLDIVNGGPAVALGNGDGTFQKPIVYPTKESAKYIHAADFNNDGRLDLAIGIVGANNTVEVAVLLGNNDGTFQSQIILVLSSTVTVRMLLTLMAMAILISFAPIG